MVYTMILVDTMIPKPEGMDHHLGIIPRPAGELFAMTYAQFIDLTIGIRNF